MKNSNLSILETEEDTNTRLYEFLATNYDISSLAKKIIAEKNASDNIWKLKQRVVSN